MGVTNHLLTGMILQVSHLPDRVALNLRKFGAGLPGGCPLVWRLSTSRCLGALFHGWPWGQSLYGLHPWQLSTINFPCFRQVSFHQASKEGIKASGGRGWSGSDGGCIGCGIGWCGCVGTVVPSDGGPGG